MKRIVATTLLLIGCSAEPGPAHAIRFDVPEGQVLWLDGQVPGLLYSITCPASGAKPSPAEIRSGSCPANGSSAAAVEPEGVIPLRWSAQTMAARRAELVCGSFRVDPVAAPTDRRILVESVDNWSIWCDFARRGSTPGP